MHGSSPVSSAVATSEWLSNTRSKGTNFEFSVHLSSEITYCSYLGFTCVHLSSNFRDVKGISFIDSSYLLAKDEFTILNERTLTNRLCFILIKYCVT